jgi:hypothetical protein
MLVIERLLEMNVQSIFKFAVLASVIVGCESPQSAEDTSRNNLQPPPRIPEPPRVQLQNVPLKPIWDIYARENVEQWVKFNLKAPSSATIHPPLIITASYDASKDETSLTAFGDVDAQNSFGAMLRSTYLAIWIKTGGPDGPDNWKMPPTVAIMGR